MKSPAQRTLRPRGQATQAKLMDAGVAVFSRKGFHATRVDDIVRRAKTSHGTFYLYFSSKDDLFEQLVSRVGDEFRDLAATVPVVDRSPERRAALEEWIEHFVRVYARFGPLIRRWTEAERDAGDASNVGDDVLRIVADALAAKVAVRKRKRFDPAIASLALMAMIERVNYFAATGQISETPEELARTLAAIVLDAFFGPEGGPPSRATPRRRT